ncbi:MAG: electron transport complex subunit RsxC [Tissierellia bacterium]|nr:electron transport complex subunit RsxC [Tissierellia bacterium]
MKVDNLTFKGGVHMHGYKELSNQRPITKAKDPSMVYIPLHQHIGAPCECIVAVGDEVKVGQKIGEAKAFVCAPVHSSVSGTVKEITRKLTPTGMMAETVVIENDGLDTLAYESQGKTLENSEPKEIISMVKEAGITGLGGASFPTHVKLSVPEDKKIDFVIINGAECEPYLTADQLSMETMPEKLLLGLALEMKAVNAPKGYVAVETNKPKAIEILRKEAEKHANIEVVSVKAKYPQGDEKRIIDAVVGRQVPSGGLPMDVGCVVSNVSSAIAIYNAVYENKPLYERIVTMTGHGIKEPQNLLVKNGTPLTELIEQAGGFVGNPGKVIMGGPMMGMAQTTLETAAIKGLGGLLILTEEEACTGDTTDCIKCGKCVSVCPVNLEPISIHKLALKERFEEAGSIYHALDCVECGSCSFICPAKRPLVESIRLAKREIRSLKQKS